MIELRSVVKTYGSQDRPALAGVDVKVERGEFVALTGPSGCGKSTMLHILGCLDRPSSGSYRLDGQDVSHLSDGELSAVRRRRIGFVFQAYHLLPGLSALDNATLPMIYAGVPRKERDRRAAELLDMMGLGAKLERRPTQLSGGECQRVAIARALANKPDVLLADEPTGNLDTKTGREVFELFEKLHSGGLTLVLVTHDPTLAARVPRRIAMRDGKVEKAPRVQSPRDEGSAGGAAS